MKELIIPQINQNESLFSTLKTRIAFAQNDNVCHDIGARIFLERAAWQAERGD